MIDMVLWRRLDRAGHEVGRLSDVHGRWELSGTAVFSDERGPCSLDYIVACDPRWRTLSASVTGFVGTERIDLVVSVDEEGAWHMDGARRPVVDGCIDIDLGFSPSTNLLPIRRLAMAVGDEREVNAAWLPFPALELEPLAQVYRREGDRLYRYTSAGGRFVRELTVNESGFVTHYPGLWQAEGMA